MAMKKIGIINNPPPREGSDEVTFTRFERPENESDESRELTEEEVFDCLLYTSGAADEN